MLLFNINPEPGAATAASNNISLITVVMPCDKITMD